jgi:hypothetical protein
VTNLWLVVHFKNQFTTINLLDLKKVGRKVLVTKGFVSCLIPIISILRWFKGQPLSSMCVVEE